MRYQRKHIELTSEERMMEADSSRSLLTEMISGIVFWTLLIGLIIYFFNHK